MSLKTSPGQLEHLGLPGAWGRTSLNFRLVHSDDPCHLAHLSAVKIEPFWTIHLCGHRSKIIWDRDDLPTKNNYICGFQDQLGPTQIWTHSHILLVKSPIWSVKPCFWPSVQIFRQLDRILGWHYPSIPSMFHGQSPEEIWQKKGPKNLGKTQGIHRDHENPAAQRSWGFPDHPE